VEWVFLPVYLWVATLTLGGRQWQGGFFLGLVTSELWVVMWPFVQAARLIRREWRDGTAHLWLRLRASVAARLLAKEAAAVGFSVTVFLLLGFCAATLLAVDPRSTAGQLAALALSGQAQVRSGPSVANSLSWLARDLGLLLACAPPMGLLGLGWGLWDHTLYLGEPRTHRGSMRRALALGLLMLLVWAAISHLVPLFSAQRAPGGKTVVKLVPAGALDVAVQVTPHLALTAWPLFLLWLAGLAAFAFSVSYLSRQTARGWEGGA
jgi:hypothetical protein